MLGVAGERPGEEIAEGDDEPGPRRRAEVPRQAQEPQPAQAPHAEPVEAEPPLRPAEERARTDRQRGERPVLRLRRVGRPSVDERVPEEEPAGARVVRDEREGRSEERARVPVRRVEPDQERGAGEEKQDAERGEGEAPGIPRGVDSGETHDGPNLSLRQPNSSAAIRPADRRSRSVGEREPIRRVSFARSSVVA